MASKTPSWFKPRGYLHFDQPVGYNKAAAIVTCPSAVAKHSFYPFINYTLTSEKISRDPNSSKLVNKPKKRPIAYASHIDSHIYAYYSEILSAHYEIELKKRGLEASVLAFRSLGKSNINFANDAFNKIKHFGECGVVGIDVSGFFDNLDHSILKEKWAAVLGSPNLPPDHYSVYRSITKSASVNRDDLYALLGISKHNPKRNRFRLCSPDTFRIVVRPSKIIKTNKSGKGIPQGSPISALLSNIYMIDFDYEVKCMMDEIGGHYYRYCDDMLFIVPENFKGKVAGEVVNKRIVSLKVSINTDKTVIRVFKFGPQGKLVADKPLQYLGFMFDGEKVTIRSSALARYSERMKRGVRLAKRSSYKQNEIKSKTGRIPSPLYKRKLYERYSHLGKRNFLRYAYRAAKTMDSDAIRRQLKPLWSRLKEEIEK